MTKAQVKRMIEAAFYAIARAAESNHESNSLLNTAFDAAVEGERGHRKRGRGIGSGYQQSVTTAARYFVVKWFSEAAPGEVMSARRACAMRLDCLYAMALRECLDAGGKTVDLGTDITRVDYCSHIVG